MYLYFLYVCICICCVFLSSPGGSDQVWHCWVPQIHEQQDKDHRRWPFRVSLEAVSESIATLITISSQPTRPISTTLRSLDLSYNQLMELPINPLSKTKALDWLNLHGWVNNWSICHDFFQEWFHKLSNQLARKMLQKKQLNLDVCPQTVIRQKFPKAIPQFESCYHQSAKMNISPTNTVSAV